MNLTKRTLLSCVHPALALSLLVQAGTLMTCCNLSPSSRSFVGEWKCGRESIKVYEKGRALVRGKRAIWGYLTEDVISIEYKENGESKAVELRATERWTDREESTVAVINWDEPEVGCEKVSEGEKGTAKAGL